MSQEPSAAASSLCCDTRRRPRRAALASNTSASGIRSSSRCSGGCMARVPAPRRCFRASVASRSGRSRCRRASRVSCAYRVPTGQARGFVLSGLRAGGITAYFNATGDLAACQWRGRWDSARTMEHYIQEAPMAAAYANLSAGVRADILRLSSVLPALLEKAGPSPAAR